MADQTTEPTPFDPEAAGALTEPLSRAEVLEALNALASAVDDDPTLAPLVVIADHVCASLDQIAATHERIVAALDMIESVGESMAGMGGPLGLLGAIGAGA